MQKLIHLSNQISILSDWITVYYFNGQVHLFT